MNLRLTKNDSSDIGFALDCLLCGAIQFKEFKEWLYFVIDQVDEPPAYIFDMLDVKLRVDFKPHRIMGWNASGSLSDTELDALEGMGFLRGIRDFEDRITREDAIEKFMRNSSFHSKLKGFFPFMDVEEFVGPDPDKGW